MCDPKKSVRITDTSLTFIIHDKLGIQATFSLNKGMGTYKLRCIFYVLQHYLLWIISVEMNQYMQIIHHSSNLQICYI